MTKHKFDPRALQLFEKEDVKQGDERVAAAAEGAGAGVKGSPVKADQVMTAVLPDGQVMKQSLTMQGKGEAGMHENV